MASKVERERVNIRGSTAGTVAEGAERGSICGWHLPTPVLNRCSMKKKKGRMHKAAEENRAQQLAPA